MSPIHLERWACAGIFPAGYKFSADAIEEEYKQEGIESGLAAAVVITDVGWAWYCCLMQVLMKVVLMEEGYGCFSEQDNAG